MIRTLRALPVLLPALVLLTACGSEDAGAADPAELASRARASGIAPELVYAVEAPGYTLAQQSVGVHGGDGFSATYVSRENGTQLRLTVDRGTVTADTCASQPTATGARAVCARDGDLWYRDAGQESEYAVPKKGFVIRVGGTGVPRDVLRDAARTVHRPSADELDALLPAGSAGGGPAERGDLPETGDGAPYDPPAAGG